MKIGLVLSGGGGKGAYELGVWKAFKDLGIDKYVKVISGTSIGAFNAALFAQNDIEKAQGLWDEVTMDMLLPLNKFELLKKGLALTVGAKNLNFVKKYMSNTLNSGNASKEGFYNVFDKFIDIKKVKDSGIICYATCTEIPDFKVRYFKINDYSDEDSREIILASVSLPLIYEGAEVNGKKYLDGGITDNTPIQPVYGEGCDFIIVVLLNKNAKFDRSKYPNTNIIEIAPKELEENVIDGVLNLDFEAKRVRIKHGYDDTINLLKPVMELAVRKYIKEDVEKYPIINKISLFMKKIKDSRLKIFNQNRKVFLTK